MILSRRHGFLFVKTRKTASTSIEVALSAFCGPDDVITPISPRDEEIRAELGYPGPRNYLKGLSEYGLKDWARLALKLRRAKRFYNHIPARQIRSLIGPEAWSGLYTFTVERHPYDKVLSYYDWLNRAKTRYASLDDFIASGRLQLLSRQGGWGLYSDESGAEVIVDQVFRYEDLERAMRTVGERAGLPRPPELPRTKHRFRKSRERTPREVLTDAQKEAIRTAFRREIETLGYET